MILDLQLVLFSGFVYPYTYETSHTPYLVTVFLHNASEDLYRVVYMWIYPPIVPGLLKSGLKEPLDFSYMRGKMEKENLL